MDLSKLSDADLMALKSGDLSKVSDDGLLALKGEKPAGLMDRMADNAKMQAGAIWGAYKDLTLGALRGAGSIGATLLSSPQQIREDIIGGGPGSQDRRNAMTEATQMLGADPSSIAYKAGKLGGEVAGTLGVGGGLAKIGAGLGANAALTGAIGSSGMSGANMLARIAGGAISGGASAGLVYPDQAKTGALIGGAMPVVAKAAGMAGNAIGSALRGGKVSPEVVRLAQRANELGIDIPADRIVNSKPLDAVASGLNYLPFSGRAATESKMAEQLNRAGARLMGQDTPNMNKALRAAGADLGAKFETTLSGNTVKVDPTFLNDLADASNKAARELGTDQAGIIAKQVDDIVAKAATGEIDGQAAYNIKKTLDRIGNRNSPEAWYALDLKGALMRALDRSLGPNEAAAFAKTREQYGNMLALEKLAKNGVEGEISVARLANLRNINNKPLQELADIAAQFVKAREGQHGAMQRAVVGAGAAATGGIPGLVAGAATGRAANVALNSNALRNLMLGQSMGATDPMVQLGYRAAPVLAADR